MKTSTSRDAKDSIAATPLCRLRPARRRPFRWPATGLTRALAAIAVSVATVVPLGALSASPGDAAVTTTAKDVPGVDQLVGVACPTATTCEAVGVTTMGQGVVVTITDGTPGALQVIAGTSALAGVACSGATTCEAVGSSSSSGGVVVPITNGVAGAARVAAGTDVLLGVACPSPSVCEAVGGVGSFSPAPQSVVVAVTNGVPGSVQTVPGISQLTAVACTSASTCEAVGWGASATSQYAVVRITNATPEAAKLVPGVGGLSAVACPDTTTCVAVGNSMTLAGTAYTYEGVVIPIASGIPGALQSVPMTAKLLGVACASAVTCEAAGLNLVPGASQALVVPISSGTAGTAIDVLPLKDLFAAVTCVSSTVCVAVGIAGGGVVGAGLVATISTSPPVLPSNTTRLGGGTRDLTSSAISAYAFPTGGSAKAAVLARDDSYADALAGAPLAAHVRGPLLITSPTGLDAGVGAELSRALPAGATVYLLGGSLALSAQVEQSVKARGFVTQRVAGADRFATAVAVAAVLGNPANVFEATGVDSTGADALCSGAAAGARGAAVLLTNGGAQAPATAAYLSAHPGTHYAVGGAAAAADPSATPEVGADRFDTCAKVAANLFSAPVIVAGANGSQPVDGLAGGALMAQVGGPLLLLNPATPGVLPPPVARYLAATPSLKNALVFGQEGAVDSFTAAAFANAA